MEATNQAYSHIDSDERIKTILNSAETFEEVKEIPARNRLTYSNGFYVDCTALFIDIRRSSELPSKHTRPVTGKIYRAYLSECVAVINSDPNCREVFINGDCVSGIMSTPYQSQANSAFETAAKLNSLIHILNWELENKGYSQLSCGIGLAYGRALMLQAGYSGSRINDIIWMGDVVNEASNLCHQGNRGGYLAVQVSSIVYNNLNDNYKGFLSPVPNAMYPTHYQGSIVYNPMETWLEEQKEQKKSRANALLGLRGLSPSIPTVLASGGLNQYGRATTLLTGNSTPRANSLANLLKIR